MKKRLSRRQFMGTAGAAGAGVFINTSAAAAPVRSPNETVDVAIIGCGGRGYGDLSEVRKAGGNIVALCDADSKRGGKAFKEFPKVKHHDDYRRMIDTQKDFDAVVVATPDHNHAPAASLAIQAKKHVYVEKPLTHSVFEARRLRELATEHKVATQMGNQGTAGVGLRRTAECIQAGAIERQRG